MTHIIESQQFSRGRISKLFTIADSLEKKGEHPLKHKILAALFYEPSTRTRFSFESAMLRLGGNVISTENAREFSSAAKGETIEDTIRVVNNYVDVIVLRHHEEGAAKRAAAVSKVPVINAGDGRGQHPSQALLDLYTIKKELGRIDGIHIAMIGDLKYGRTVRSLTYLLGKYRNIKIYFVSTKELRIGIDIVAYLKRHHISYAETTDMASVLNRVDVIYQTRIQKERFSSLREYKRLKNKYRLTPAALKRIRPHAIIMHPLPRLDELSSEIDEMKNAVYFRQTYYGLLIRMALLKFVLKK